MYLQVIFVCALIVTVHTKLYMGLCSHFPKNQNHCINHCKKRLFVALAVLQNMAFTLTKPAINYKMTG